MEENDTMQAIVLLNDNIKLNTINNVKVIRVKDGDYNLLIMKDYWPVIGEINGNVYFDGDENVSFENIKGFYMLCHNVFRLIIIEDK
jgi:hypothetical protein